MHSDKTMQQRGSRLTWSLNLLPLRPPTRSSQVVNGTMSFMLAMRFRKVLSMASTSALDMPLMRRLCSLNMPSFISSACSNLTTAMNLALETDSYMRHSHQLRTWGVGT